MLGFFLLLSSINVTESLMPILTLQIIIFFAHYVLFKKAQLLFVLIAFSQ